MSLLNDVLRDLDQRRRERGEEGRSVLDGLRPAPEGPEGKLRTRGIFAVALAVTILVAVVIEVRRGDQPDAVALPAVAARPPVEPIATPQVPMAPAVAPANVALGAAAADVVRGAAPAPVAVAVPVPVAVAHAKPRSSRELADIARPIEIIASIERSGTERSGSERSGSERSGTEGRESEAPETAVAAGHLFETGLEQAARGQSAAAETSLRECLSRDPHHREARVALATLLARDGRQAAALSLLEGGRRLAEDAGAFGLIEAHIRAGAGDAEAALLLLETSVPPSLEAEVLRAALYQRTNRHVEAAEGYSALVLRDASRGVWWMGLGISLEALGEEAPALAAYRRAQVGDGLDGATRVWVRGRAATLRGSTEPRRR